MACERFSLKDLIKKDRITTFWWFEEENISIAAKLLEYIEKNTDYKWGYNINPTNNLGNFNKNWYNCLVIDQKLFYMVNNTKNNLEISFIRNESKTGTFEDAIEIKSIEDIC